MSALHLSSIQMLAFGLLLAFLPAAQAAEEDAERYTDKKFDFSLAVPESWKSARLQDYTVPGTARAAWSGKKNASIVAFVQEPGMAYSPRFLVDASAEAQKEKLGAEVLAKEVRTVGGMKAMWMVVEGQGNGGAITGKGDVKTTQHWVAIPRAKDVVILLLTSPSADYAENKKSFEKALSTLKVGGMQTDEQKTAK